MTEEQIIVALAALAQTHRLRIFRQLVTAGPEGLNPGALAETLAIPAATLSFHLKELSQASLVSQERQGRQLRYRACFPQMQALVDYLTENCCAGSPCCPP